MKRINYDACQTVSIMLKVLNLYAGLGGNRKLWKDADVTAVESNPVIAGIYGRYHPDDTVITGDAHKYLLDHYKEFDFIWSSPPCPSHSRIRYRFCVRNTSKLGYRRSRALYPDMRLYEEIIFLQYHCGERNDNGIWWLVENVRPYYEPLIAASTTLGRHLAWCNFECPKIDLRTGKPITAMTNAEMTKAFGFDVSKADLKSGEKTKALRNCVIPELGRHVMECVTRDMVAAA